MHRLWYDLRTQSMFEPEIREAVLEIDHTLELMIWRIVRRYAELTRRRAGVDSPTTYGMFDGMFEERCSTTWPATPWPPTDWSSQAAG